MPEERCQPEIELVSTCKLDFEVQNLLEPLVMRQAAYLLIAAGAFVFIVSFLGYCGAVKESRVLLALVTIRKLSLSLSLSLSLPFLPSLIQS